MKLIQIRDTAHGTELRVKYILVGQRQQLAWHHVVSFCDLYSDRLSFTVESTMN